MSCEVAVAVPNEDKAGSNDEATEEGSNNGTAEEDEDDEDEDAEANVGGAT